MRWKSEPARPLREESAARAPEEAAPERVSGELQARGVAAPVAEALAPRLADQVEGRSGEERARILDGIALGLRAQQGVADDLSQTASDLQEIERLMTSFATELTKLDEVLEVLAAYLRRMRTVTPASGSRILH